MREAPRKETGNWPGDSAKLMEEAQSAFTDSDREGTRRSRRERWQSHALEEAPPEFFNVPRRRRRGLGKVVGALLATLVVVALLLVHVYSRYGVLKMGYTLSELSKEREELLEENRRLRIEHRMLTRTDRLEPLAERQLGLIVPAHDQILYVPATQLALPEMPTHGRALAGKLPVGSPLAAHVDRGEVAQ